MSSRKKKMDNTHAAAILGWASVRKKDFMTTPLGLVLPVISLVWTGLTSLRFVYETRIEPQLDVAAVALDRPIRITDPHDVDTPGILAEEPMLETEVPHKVHF